MRAFLARALVVGMMAVAVLAAMTAAAAAQPCQLALFACAGPASAASHLLQGGYQSRPVRRTEVPLPGGLHRARLS